MDKLNQEELANMQSLLENILKPDTLLVNQSKEAINNMKDKQPEKLILSLLYILINGQRNYKLSAVLLRQILTVMDGLKNFVWNELSPDTQSLVKYNLAQALAATKIDPDVRRNICLVCSELAGTLADCDEVWSEVLGALDVLLQKTADDSMKICGYQFLADTFPYFMNTYTKNLRGLKNQFETTLTEDSFTVKAECLKAITAVIFCVDAEQREMFESLVPLVTESILFGDVSEKDLKSVIIDLTAIAETNPRFLKDGFLKLFQICITIAKASFITKEIPGLAIELLVTAIEHAPSLLLEDKMLAEIGSYYSELFEAILSSMRANIKEFPVDWVKPAEYTELPFDESVSQGQQAIDRILTCTRRDFGLSLLDPQVLKLFSGDWSCKYVALLAGARIGPFVKSPTELSIFVPSVCGHAIKNKDPRIRLGAVRALRSLAEESDEVFHSNYHKAVMNGLIEILEDEVGRLRQEGCSAIRSFIGRLKREELDRYIEPLIKSLSKLIDSDIAPIDEIALSAIGTITEVTPDTFDKRYYSQMMPILMIYLNSPGAKHRALRERLIEVLTIIAKQVGKNRFEAYFPQLARAIAEHQKRKLQSHELEQRVIPCWQRMSQLYSKELSPYINELIEPLIIFAKPPIQQYMNNVEVHIEDYSEKEQALNLLAIFIGCIGPELEKFAGIIEELLVLILQSPNNETLKPIAARSLKNLLIEAKESCIIDKPIKIGLIALISALKIDKGLTTVESELKTTLDIFLLLDGPCFSEAEVLEIFEELMSLAIDSSTRSIILKDQLNELDSNYEDNLISLLGQTIAALIRSHPNEFIEVFKVIYLKVLKENLLNPPSNPQIIFALTILSAALKFLTYSRIPTIYEESVGLIMQYVTYSDPQIRSVALEGLASSVISAGQHSSAVANQCFESIGKILMTPMPEQVSRKDWQIAKERAVVCLSQIVISQTTETSPKIVEMTKLWLHNLPLKHIQGKEQIDLLAQRMASNLLLVTGANGENLKDVLRIIAEVLDTKQVDTTSSQQIMGALKTIMEMKKWERKRSEAYNELSKCMQNKLNEYANSVMLNNY